MTATRNIELGSSNPEDWTENKDGVLELKAEIADKQKLEEYYAVLDDEKSKFADIKNAISQMLEKVGNQEDCFWISHAWA